MTSSTPPPLPDQPMRVIVPAARRDAEDTVTHRGGSRPGRDTYTYKQLKRRLRDERRPRCWLCGQRIDYDLDPADPSSFSVDHIVPVSVAPDRAEDYSNLAPAHLACNKARSNGEPIAALGAGATIQQW